MEEIFFNTIRRLTVGPVKTGFKFIVGRNYGSEQMPLYLVSIVPDFILYEKNKSGISFSLYCRNSKGEEIIWQVSYLPFTTEFHVTIEGKSFTNESTEVGSQEDFN